MRTLENLILRITNNYAVYQTDMPEEWLEYLLNVHGFVLRDSPFSETKKHVIDPTWHRGRPDTYKASSIKIARERIRRDT